MTFKLYIPYLSRCVRKAEVTVIHGFKINSLYLKAFANFEENLVNREWPMELELKFNKFYLEFK